MINVLQILEMINENSGVSSVVMNYYQHMDKDRIHFDFIVHTDVEESVKKEVESRGSKIYRMPDLSGRNIPRYKRELNRFFKEHQGEYQIVHGHLPNAAMFYLASAKKYGIKVRILHSHNSQGADGVIKRMRNSVMNRMGINLATDYVACSHMAAEYLFGEKRKTHILYNAINIDRYGYREDVREKLRERYDVKDKLVVGHIGRFQAQKNHKFILDIVETVTDDRICFLLLGDGPLREYIEQEAQRRRLADRIIFAGSVKNAEDYYQMMDVFILPSLYEGLPVVGVEAQAAGLPCLMSDAITEEVSLSQNIRFLPIDDVGIWIRNIQDIDKSRKDNRDRIVSRGFAIESEAKNLFDMYEKMIKKAYE